MDFMEKLKAMIMGSQPPPQAPPQGNPWEDPSLSGGLPRPSPAPPQMAPAMGPQDDIERQVQMLQKQRDIAKRFIPEGTWNR